MQFAQFASAMTTSHDPVALARDALRGYNAKRYDPVQRDLFWSAERWEALLDALRAAEGERDETLQRQIADRALSSAYLPSYEELLFTQLQQDEQWYAREAAALAHYAASAAPGAPTTAHTLEEAWHTLLLEQRLHDRRVRLAEVGLEIIERRRRAQGLPSGRWPAAWQRLSAAWADQDAWHQQLCEGAGRPDLALAQVPNAWRHDASRAWGDRSGSRLAWLRWLGAYQEESRRAAAQAGQATRDLDADMATLAQAIERLAPPQRLADAGSGGAVALLAAMAVAALVLLIGGAVIGAGQDVPAAPAAPEGALSGSAIPLATASAAPATASAAEIKATGRALLDAGQCGDAVTAYEAALQIAPDDYELYNDVAFCLYDLGRVDEALARWDAALARNPNSADARAGLAMALLSQGQAAAARDSYARALAIEPRYADPVFLREQRSWSEVALAASQPLRDALAAP